MRVQDYVGKISWTAADKVLFVLYGFVALLQYRAIPPAELGLTSELVGLQTWIFILSDGAALQSLIQFGYDRERRPQVNAAALLFQCIIVLGLSLITAALSTPLSYLFQESRFSLVALWLPVYCLLTIPRAYCLKILLRDTQMKQVFWVNFFWFASMIGLTLWMLAHNTLRSFDDMVFINCTGMATSSVAAIVISRKLLRFSWNQLRSSSEFLRFGSVQVFIGAITNAIRQLDIFILQFFFHDLGVVGIYTAAKTLYRVFETGMDALFSLLYPSAIRLLPDGKKQEFSVILSKAVSYLFLSYVFIIGFMELGGTSLIVRVLGGKYLLVTGQFNLMALAALFVPFYPLSAALLAMNRNALLLRYVIVASLCGLLVFCLSGLSGQSSIFALGVIIYNAVLSILLILYVQRELAVRPLDYLRALPDALRFLKSR